MNSSTSDHTKEPAQNDRREQLDSIGEGEKSSRWVLHLTLLLLLIIPLVLWLTGSSPSSEGPGAGDSVGTVGNETENAAPDFTLELFDGTTFSLSDHLEGDGRPVVMNFWASWCLPCREEMPAFDAVARRRPDVYFLGVAVQDTEPDALAFAEEIAVTYPLGFDADGTIVDLYPILGLPTTRFITSDGIVAASWSGILDETRLESLIEEHFTG